MRFWEGVGMVHLSLASLAPFRTLKEKVMLKLTMVRKRPVFTV